MRSQVSQVRGWRRVASAMWDAPNDPQIYGALEIDAAPVLQFIEQARAHGHRLTATHLVGRAVSEAVSAVPELNVRIVGTSARPRPSVDVFFITAVDSSHDLSGIKVSNVDKRAVVDIAAEIAQRSAQLRSGDDREFKRTKTLMDHLPRAALRMALHASALLTERFQIELPSLSLHKSPFGSVMVSSVGMFGLPQGFAPLAWMYDVPLLLLVGEIVERPVVVDHQVVARPVIPMTATIDHRYVDGAAISRAMRALRDYLADPAAFEPLFAGAPHAEDESEAATAP